MEDYEVVPSTEDHDVIRSKRSRPRRAPSQPVLRTGFRNFSGVATILVGEPNNKSRPETKYLIHQELLTAASPFFAAALDGTFAEGLDQTVRLPEEKPEIFEWFLQWLYTGTLRTPVPKCKYLFEPPNPKTPALHAHTNAYAHYPPLPPAYLDKFVEYEVRTDGALRNDAGSPKYFLLIDLYALSDRLLTTPLSNAILSTIARLSEATNSVPTPSDTWILYEGGGIRDTSPLRSLVLDLFAYKKTDKLLGSHKDEWHPRFLRELCVKLKAPGPEAIERHALVAWRPAEWSSSRACEVCREVLQPGSSGDKCVACEKVFCMRCMQTAGQGKSGGLTDTGGCKPWSGRGMCVRYHEHGEGEGCG